MQFQNTLIEGRERRFYLIPLGSFHFQGPHKWTPKRGLGSKLLRCIAECARSNTGASSLSDLGSSWRGGQLPPFAVESSSRRLAAINGTGAKVSGRHGRGLGEVSARSRSAGAEREHPLDVPGHGDEAPLAADIVEPAQQELAESHHRFDDAEHRFRGLLAQGVELLALRGAQPIAPSPRPASGFPAPAARAAKRSRQDG